LMKRGRGATRRRRRAQPARRRRGLLGREDERAIAPGIVRARERLRASRIAATLDGPVPAESAFRLAVAKRWDGVVAMYHDQATIPMKLVEFGEAVNLSLACPSCGRASTTGPPTTRRDLDGRCPGNGGGRWRSAQRSQPSRDRLVDPWAPGTSVISSRRATRSRERRRRGEARRTAAQGEVAPRRGKAVTTVDNTFGDDDRAKLAASTSPLPAVLTAEWLDDADREELRIVWQIDAGGPLALKYRSHGVRRERPPTRSSSTERTTTSTDRQEHRAHRDRVRVWRGPRVHWDEEEVVPAFGASSGIFAECEACSRTFDPTKGAAVLTNPFDGTKTSTRGGAAYRFAIKVDCGQMLRRRSGARVRAGARVAGRGRVRPRLSSRWEQFASARKAQWIAPQAARQRCPTWPSPATPEAPRTRRTRSA